MAVRVVHAVLPAVSDCADGEEVRVMNALQEVRTEGGTCRFGSRIQICMLMFAVLICQVRAAVLQRRSIWPFGFTFARLVFSSPHYPGQLAKCYLHCK